MSKAYLFIDGNNFYHNLKGMKIKPSHIDFEKLRNVICKNFKSNCITTFYYNSVPSIKDGAPMYYSHMKFLAKLQKIPDFVVKTRKLQRNSTTEILQRQKELVDSMELCEVCDPIVRTIVVDSVGDFQKKEKGIDIMIAVDMLNFCVIKKECQTCILLSGDADFHPALNIIENYGGKVYNVSVPKGYSYQLRSSFKHFILSREVLIKNCLKSK